MKRSEIREVSIDFAFPRIALRFMRATLFHIRPHPNISPQAEKAVKPTDYAHHFPSFR